MRIVDAKDLGLLPVFDLEVGDEHHSFVHETGVVVHNSAFVIMNEPVNRRIPTMTISDVVTTQYTMNDVEAMGGIKMDFLVVNSLRDIGDCVKLVQKRSGEAIPAEGVVMEDRGLVPRHQLVPHGMQLFDVWHLPDEDAVHREIVQGKTETVFQLSTPGAIGWLKYFQANRPDGRPAMSSLRDLAYFTSLDRPGPLDMFVKDPDGGGDQKHNMLVEYAHRVRGMRPSPDVLPVMERLFPETHGIMITQEQLQYAYQDLTGCTGTEAEGFRRLISKKKFEDVEKKFSFFHPLASQKIGKEEARQAWETMKVFGQYGFNLSHAVCYALIGYVCAWFKHHYPLEWWCSVLRNADKDEIAGKFWAYAGHMIDLPDLSRVTPTFEVFGDRIVAPLSLLRGVGEVAHAQLVAGAPYRNLADLVQRIQDHKKNTSKVVRKMKRNKKTGEEKEVEVVQLGRSAIDRRVVYASLIVGAMDSLLPAELRDVPVVDKLTHYEKVFAEVTGAKRPQKVPAWYANVGPLARYVMRKKILSAYAEDVRPILVELDLGVTAARSASGGLWYRWRGMPLVDGKGMRRLETFAPLPQNGLETAALAFVLDVRKFSYGEGKSKHATEFMLDIDGESFKMVAWPGKGRKVIPDDVKHHLVMVHASRWAENKGFSINGLEVVQVPVTEEVVEETDDQRKGVDVAGRDGALPEAGGDGPGGLRDGAGGDGHGGPPGQGLPAGPPA